MYQKKQLKQSSQKSKKKKFDEYRTPIKGNNENNLIVQKYLQVKLNYSEQKKNNVQKMLQCKQQRIKVLQNEIYDNQRLVKDTLVEWKKFQNKTERQSQDHLKQLQMKIINIKESLQNVQQKLQEKQIINKNLIDQNDRLEEKNKELTQKYNRLVGQYRKDKVQWKYICGNLKYLIQGLQKMPPQVLQLYFS